MILVGRSLDKFKAGSDAQQCFLKARHVELSYGAGRFNFIQDANAHLPNSQCVVNRPANLTLFWRPVLKSVEH